MKIIITSSEPVCISMLKELFHSLTIHSAVDTGTIQLFATRATFLLLYPLRVHPKSGKISSGAFDKQPRNKALKIMNTLQSSLIFAAFYPCIKILIVILYIPHEKYLHIRFLLGSTEPPNVTFL